MVGLGLLFPADVSDQPVEPVRDHLPCHEGSRFGGDRLAGGQGGCAEVEGLFDGGGGACGLGEGFTVDESFAGAKGAIANLWHTSR